MKVGKPGNLRYIEDITETVFKKYDDHLITRRQAIDILTSWEVAITTEGFSTWPEKSDGYSVVKFKLQSDVFGEYDGNDPVEKWKHISESIEENYVSPDVVRHDPFSSGWSKILEKVEEKAKLSLSDEDAKNKARLELERALAADDARIKEEKRLCQEFNAKEKE